MHAFIMFSEQTQHCGDESGTRVDAYTYCDYPFKMGVDNQGYSYGRSGYGPTANIDRNCEDAFINRDQVRAVLVQVDVPEEDLAFSDDYEGKGERTFGYPYSRWVRSVDFRKPQYTMEQVLAGEAGTVLWVRELTPAHEIERLKARLAYAEQEARSCQYEADGYQAEADDYRDEAAKLRAQLEALTAKEA